MDGNTWGILLTAFGLTGTMPTGSQPASAINNIYFRASRAGILNNLRTIISAVSSVTDTNIILNVQVSTATLVDGIQFNSGLSPVFSSTLLTTGNILLTDVGPIGSLLERLT